MTSLDHIGSGLWSLSAKFFNQNPCLRTASLSNPLSNPLPKHSHVCAQRPLTPPSLRTANAFLVLFVHGKKHIRVQPYKMSQKLSMDISANKYRSDTRSYPRGFDFTPFNQTKALALLDLNCSADCNEGLAPLGLPQSQIKNFLIWDYIKLPPFS